MKCESEADSLIYAIRPEITDRNDGKAADSKPTEAVTVESGQGVLKKWILPSRNEFIKDPAPPPLCGRRICLVGMELFGRAYSPLPGPEFLLRYYRFGGIQKRPLLFVSIPLAT